MLENQVKQINISLERRSLTRMTDKSHQRNVIYKKGKTKLSQKLRFNNDDIVFSRCVCLALLVYYVYFQHFYELKREREREKKQRKKDMKRKDRRNCDEERSHFENEK